MNKDALLPIRTIDVSAYWRCVVHYRGQSSILTDSGMIPGEIRGTDGDTKRRGRPCVGMFRLWRAERDVKNTQQQRAGDWSRDPVHA